MLNNKLVSSKVSKIFFQFHHRIYTVPTTVKEKVVAQKLTVGTDEEKKFLPVIVKNIKKTSTFDSETIKKKNLSVLEEERLLNEYEDFSYTYTYTYTYDYKWLNQYLK